MSQLVGRKALWQDDGETNQCTKCREIFSYTVHRHHCRKCGLIYCGSCTPHKMIIPAEELSKRPSTWAMKQGLFSDVDDFREPQRVCEECSYSLRPIQDELRQSVSRCNMETDVSSNNDGSSWMPNMPSLDFYLENEIKNAALMLNHFKMQGEERIPKGMLDIAKGVAFLTVLKAGFMVSGRFGTGIVISRLSDNSWSAPSAITISGVGWGLQIGGEVTDVMLILTSDSAVETFKSRGQMTVGAELGVSVGPVGKSVESDVTAGNKGGAHCFSYANSRGLFVGASLEACVIAQRKEVNCGFYGEKVGASALLAGDYLKPRGAEPLYAALDDIVYSNGTGSANEETLNRRRLREVQYEALKAKGAGGAGRTGFGRGQGQIGTAPTLQVSTSTVLAGVAAARSAGVGANVSTGADGTLQVKPTFNGGGAGAASQAANDPDEYGLDV